MGAILSDRYEGLLGEFLLPLCVRLCRKMTVHHVDPSLGFSLAFALDGLILGFRGFMLKPEE